MATFLIYSWSLLVKSWILSLPPSQPSPHRCCRLVFFLQTLTLSSWICSLRLTFSIDLFQTCPFLSAHLRATGGVKACSEGYGAFLNCTSVTELQLVLVLSQHTHKQNVIFVFGPFQGPSVIRMSLQNSFAGA